MSDLYFKNYALWVYEQIDKDIPYVAIGLEQGAHFAKYFCNKYHEKCIELVVIIDRNFTEDSFEKTFNSISNHEKLKEFTGETNIEKYKIKNITNGTIQNVLHKIFETKDDKYINLLNGLCKGIIRSQYDKINKINVPTIIYSDVNVLTPDKLRGNRYGNIPIYMYINQSDDHYYPIHGQYAQYIIQQIYGCAKLF